MPNRSSGASTEPAPAPAADFTSNFMPRSRTWLAGAFTALRTNTSPPFGPGTAPFTKQQPALGVALDDLEVERGDARVAVLAGHLHALEDAGRRCARADRAGRTVLLVVPVARALTLEVVTLHRAGEALALADAGDVDTLAGLEEVGAEHLTDLEAGEVVDAQLGEVARGGRVGLLQVPELGLREPLRLRGAERQLDRGIAVALGRLELDDAAGPGLDHRHRDDAVLVVPDLGHAELAPEDPFGSHLLVSPLRRPALRARLRFVAGSRALSLTRTLRPASPGGA